MPRVLIVYATNHGHTATIANAMADTLRARGIATDVAAASTTAPAVTGYDAAIVAASLHAGKYQKSAVRWVRSNREALSQKRTAFVSVSLGVLQQEERVQQDVRATVDRFLADTRWAPNVVKMVAGALFYTRYGWLIRLIMKRIAAKAGGDTDTRRDYVYTDWEDLQAFTSAFADRLMAGSEPGRSVQGVAMVGGALAAGRATA